MSTVSSSPSVSSPLEDGALLRGKPLFFGRLGWVLITLATVGLDLYAIPALYQQVATPCPDRGPCGDAQYTVSQVALLHNSVFTLSTVAGLTVIEQTVATLLFAALAAILFWRRSDDRMALFAAYMLVTFGGAAFNGATQALPDVNHAWFVPVMTLNIVGQVTFVTFFFLFPNGRFVPRWTRWVALLWLLAWLTAYFPGSALNMIADTLLNGLLFVVLLFILVFAQVYRYQRVSNARQRQQTKWVVYGFALGIGCFAAMIIVVNLAFGALVNADPLVHLASSTAVYILISLIPVTIGIAILRSRLYDIDIIIRRTLVYGSLTAILVAIYAVGVIGAQTAIGAFTGGGAEQQPFLIVATTLLVAALFQPLRRRLQHLIDRSFYRTRYDAARMLAIFGATLRNEVELNALTDHLIGTVEDAMRPAHVSLWLRTPEEP